MNLPRYRSCSDCWNMSPRTTCPLPMPRHINCVLCLLVMTYFLHDLWMDASDVVKWNEARCVMSPGTLQVYQLLSAVMFMTCLLTFNGWIVCLCVSSVYLWMCCPCNIEPVGGCWSTSSLSCHGNRDGFWQLYMVLVGKEWLPLVGHQYASVCRGQFIPKVDCFGVFSVQIITIPSLSTFSLTAKICQNLSSYVCRGGRGGEAVTAGVRVASSPL